MIRNQSNKGLTLIEIIIGLAFLGIIAMVVLSTFTSGISGIVIAGQRTETLMSLHAIVDDLVSRPFPTKAAIESYATAAGYNVAVGNEEVKAGASGFPVVITGTFRNGTQKVQVTTFILKGGY